MAYRFALWGLSALLVLSCSQEPPVSSLSSAFAEDSGPWQTVSINGATYRRVAAKPTETSQADLLITIPISYTVEGGAVRFSDTVQIAGRTYTADCGTDGGQSGGGDDVGNTRATATDLIVPQATSSATGEYWFSPNYVLTAGDVDYFRLRVTGQTIDLAVSSSGGTDTYGQLLDSSGLVLDENDDRFSNPPDFFVIAFRVEPGTYYLKVRGANSNTTGTYSLTVGAWLPSAGKVVAATYEQQLP